MTHQVHVHLKAPTEPFVVPANMQRVRAAGKEHCAYMPQRVHSGSWASTMRGRFEVTFSALTLLVVSKQSGKQKLIQWQAFTRADVGCNAEATAGCGAEVAEESEDDCMVIRFRQSLVPDEYEIVIYCKACNLHFNVRHQAEGGLGQNLKHLASGSHRRCITECSSTSCEDFPVQAPSITKEVTDFIRSNKCNFEWPTFGPKQHVLCKLMCKAKKSRHARIFNLASSTILDLRSHPTKNTSLNAKNRTDLIRSQSNNPDTGSIHIL